MSLIRAYYVPDDVIVDVIQDGDIMAFIKFPNGRAIWVKADELDFDVEESLEVA